MYVKMYVKMCMKMYVKMYVKMCMKSYLNVRRTRGNGRGNGLKGYHRKWRIFKGRTRRAEQSLNHKPGAQSLPLSHREGRGGVVHLGQITFDAIFI